MKIFKYLLFIIVSVAVIWSIYWLLSLLFFWITKLSLLWLIIALLLLIGIVGTLFGFLSQMLIILLLSISPNAKVSRWFINANCYLNCLLVILWIWKYDDRLIPKIVFSIFIIGITISLTGLSKISIEE